MARKDGLIGLENIVLKRKLEEDEDIDEDYKRIILCLLTEAERFETNNKQKYKYDPGSNEECETNNKQKDKYDPGLNAECDPEPRRKSAGASRKKIKKTNKCPTCGKFRNEIDNVENVKGSPNGIVPDSECVRLHRKVKLEDGGYVSVQKGITLVKGRRLESAVREKVGLSNHMPNVENHRKDIDPQSTSIKKNKRLPRRKSGNEADEAESIVVVPGPEYQHFLQNVKLEDDQCVYKHKGHTLMNGLKKVKTENCSDNELRNALSTEHFMVPTNIDEDNLEKGQRQTVHVPDVEIVDANTYLKEGIPNPFPPSKIFRDDIQHIDRSSACSEFKERVLDVLKKPFDKEEYIGHQEAFKSYLDYHPDVVKKLKKYRYNKRKRLIIYRGFFFWLQNLMQQGAFRPWKKRECLVVEPGS